jgi:hypothetical protein
VGTARELWHQPPALEFYVDFETVSDLDDDFAGIPERGGQNLICMIGCGHVEEGEWRYECFTADRIAEPDEAVIIDDWFTHMAAVRDRLAPGSDPSAVHWSHHEVSWLEEAFFAAAKRRPENDWPHPNWFDFLVKVDERDARARADRCPGHLPTRRVIWRARRSRFGPASGGHRNSLGELLGG